MRHPRGQVPLPTIQYRSVVAQRLKTAPVGRPSGHTVDQLNSQSMHPAAQSPLSRAYMKTPSGASTRSLTVAYQGRACQVARVNSGPLALSLSKSCSVCVASALL